VRPSVSPADRGNRGPHSHLGQLREPGPDAGVELVGRQVVGAGGAAVDDDDGYAGARGPAYEPEAGHHRERRAGDEQRTVVLDQRVDGVEAAGHDRRRDVLAEEDDVWLEDAAARLARGDDEAGGLLELDVEVRPVDERAERVAESRVESGQAFLEPGSRGHLGAGQAHDLGDPAVQRHEASAAGGLVQPVDVLGDQQLGIEGGERPVRGVGLGTAHPGPAEERPGPVPLPGRGARAELRDRHRGADRRPRPAVVGDAGVRGDTGPGEDDQRPSAEDVLSAHA
jgi:hypothetical protein